MDSIRDFSSSSPKKISCKVIAVSNSIETEGGRTSVFVQDYQYRECCTYLMSFHDDNETIVNEIQINGIYIIRNARLDVNNRKESHYPFRIVLQEDTVIEHCEEATAVLGYCFKPFPEVIHGPVLMKHVDIAAIIDSVGSNLKSKKFNEKYRKIKLRDEDRNILELIIWRTSDNDPIINNWRSGQIMLIKRALVIQDFKIRCDRPLRDIRVIGVLDELEPELDQETLEVVGSLEETVENQD